MVDLTMVLRWQVAAGLRDRRDARDRRGFKREIGLDMVRFEV